MYRLRIYFNGDDPIAERFIATFRNGQADIHCHNGHPAWAATTWRYIKNSYYNIILNMLLLYIGKSIGPTVVCEIKAIVT